MAEPMENPTPGTVPEQPEATAPLRKKYPLLIGLMGIILLFGVVNVIGLIAGKKSHPAPKGSITQRPSTANSQEVASFETQQRLEAERDAQRRARQQRLSEQLRQLEEPGPESQNAPPMTDAQRAAIYGDGNPNAPQRVSGMSEAQAEAKQRRLAREKQHQDAINSDTVAIDFARSATAPPKKEGATNAPAESGADTTDPETARTLAELAQQENELRELAEQQKAAEAVAVQRGGGNNAPTTAAPPVTGSSQPQTGSTPEAVAHKYGASAAEQKPEARDAALRRYDFDDYDGKLYRVFEGTVLEGVVTNHIDGAVNGPILIMLTTDYYSHDHQQLLLPQGTRLIGSVQSVSSMQQRKLLVTFHRAVCPDGFSVDLDKFPGLDPLGTTGLATKVNHQYWQTFGAAALIGGLGGLAQSNNGGIGVYGGDPGVLIRNGISEQTGREAEQILNHFLNRLPIITLKEGARARVYIGRDILIPSYADHRVAANL